MMHRFHLLAFSLALGISSGYAQFAGHLKQGKHFVGFSVVDLTDTAGKPYRFCIWYPAQSDGSKMKLSDYIEVPLIGGSTDPATLRTQFKETLELPFLFRLDKIAQNDFDKALQQTLFASRDVPMSPGKWPLVVMDNEPSMLIATAEYLGGHGFIVASPAVQFPAPVADDSIYELPTRSIEFLVSHLIKQPFADGTRVNVLGFGGGAFAGFFAAMRNPSIRAMVSIEGGLFMPISKTTIAKDYVAKNFKIPLLHIVQPNITAGEREEEFRAIGGDKFRLTVLSPQVRHHDFSTYGRTVTGLLGLRGPAAEAATDSFDKVNEQVLYFLQHRAPQFFHKSCDGQSAKTRW